MPDPPTFISLTTDFGSFYSGICVGVLARLAPHARVLVVSAELPPFAVTAGAMRLRAALPFLPVGVHIGIVDPGVGTDRRPIAIRCGRGDVLIGPDNGLLTPAAAVLGGAREVREVTNPDFHAPDPAPTFHGRDIFAPTAARLATGASFADVGPAVVPIEPNPPRPQYESGSLRATVLFVDDFGNLVLGAGPTDLGAVPIGTPLRVHGRRATRVDTFADVGMGELAVLTDSSGWLAVAVNQGNAARELGLALDDPVLIEIAAPA